MVDVPTTIDCIDCGEPCHLTSYAPNERDWEAGDLTTYRCSGCGDRWDLVIPDEDEGRGDEHQTL